MTSPIPEIERTVVTILNHTSPFHLVLRAWIRQLASDPEYADNLEDFPVSAELRRECEAVGYRWQAPPPRTLADLIMKHQAYDVADSSDIAKHPGTPFAETVTSLAAAFDEAIYRLALSLVFYRRRGRPPGGTPPELEPLAGPFGLVTTGLGAAVADYAIALANLAWMARDEWYYSR